jgi:hypothetical protein
LVSTRVPHGDGAFAGLSAVAVTEVRQHYELGNLRGAPHNVVGMSLPSSDPEQQRINLSFGFRHLREDCLDLSQFSIVIGVNVRQRGK